MKKLQNIRKTFFKIKQIYFIILFVSLSIFCGGKNNQPSVDTNVYLDREGALQNLTTIKTLLLDQFTLDKWTAPKEINYVLRPEWLDIWITDENNNLILCTNAMLGFNEIEIENIAYGNLNTSFYPSSNKAGYQNNLFKIQVYTQLEGWSYCKKSNKERKVDIGFFEQMDVPESFFVGETPVVNFKRLTQEPLLATNGSFYIRLKNQPNQINPLPRNQAANSINDQILIDQVKIIQTSFDEASQSESVMELNEDNNITWQEEINRRGRNEETPSADIQENPFATPNREIEIITLLVDADTNLILGASATEEGLNPVTRFNVIYGQLYASFFSPSGKITINSDLLEKEVYVIALDYPIKANQIDFDEPFFDEEGRARYSNPLGLSKKMHFIDLPGKTIQLFIDDQPNGFIRFMEIKKLEAADEIL